MRLLQTIAAIGLIAILPAVAAEIPRTAPDLSFKTPAGQTHKVSNYKGKVLVVEVLRPSCPHCQNSAKILAKLQSELGPKGLQVVGVGFPGDGDLASFVSTYGVNFPVGVANRDEVLGFLQHSLMQQSFYFPQMVFIDQTGIIRAQYSGVDPFLGGSKEEANIRGLVTQLLGGAGKTSTTRKGA